MRPDTTTRLSLPALAVAALLSTTACDSGSSGSSSVHEFSYDSDSRQYTVAGTTVSAAEVARDLNGSLCGKCHADALAEVKGSVHYSIAAPTERVWFPGGGAHGMLDRACGLPSTTGLTNYTSDINLGECAKCHVGRYLPVMEGFFASMFQQMGLPNAQEQATRLVDGGVDCLICHSEEYQAVAKGGTLALVAPAAEGSASPTRVGSARSARDNADFDHDGAPDPLLDTDGDGVADTPLMYDSNGDGLPDKPWNTVAQDRSVAALRSIGPTTEHACLRCHEHARTGYKRGTLYIAGHDVHAGSEAGVFAGAENSCTVCHTAHDHKFVRGHSVGGDLAAADFPPPAPGIAHDPNDPTDLACIACHDTTNDPQLASVHIQEHLDKIACETCHIPYGSGITYSLFGHGGQVSFARNAAGKDTKLVVADMYVTGDRADLDSDFNAYRTQPILTWFNGGTSFLAQSLAARGMPNAKITPFKPMANGMVFDARFFDGLMMQSAGGVPYNAHSMYRFFENGNNADAFAALGMLDLSPAATRTISLADFMSPDPDRQGMALMQLFPNLVYFDKARFGYEHYLTATGSPFDGDRDGIIDPGQPFQFDMLDAAYSGLQQFAGFNGPMGFPPNYQWYPQFFDVSDLISMKLPDGSEIKMFLQMQAQQLPEPQRTALLDAVEHYPSYSQVTLGGHGVRPKSEALDCTACHAPGGVLSQPVPVGRRITTNMGAMGFVDLPLYQWKYYNLHALVDLGLSATCEQVVAGTADVDIDGDAAYLRESTDTFVVNWFMPEMPGGFRRADDAQSLAGAGLTPAELTWSGGDWMPVLEPVVDLLPNWQALGLPASVIW